MTFTVKNLLRKKFSSAAGISFIGQATGTTSITTMPTHQAGDLIIIFAYRAGSTSAPTVPTGSGYTSKLTNTAAEVVNAAQAAVVGFKIAASGSETSGTWTNASRIVCHVYRGVDQTTPLGGSSTYDIGNNGNGTTLTYEALTMQITNGTSWLVAFAGSIGTSGTGTDDPPGAMVNRSTLASSNYVAGHDTNGGVSSWSRKTKALGANTDWMTFCVEIRAAA
jgi:hypothetical protein